MRFNMKLKEINDENQHLKTNADKDRQAREILRMEVSRIVK